MKNFWDRAIRRFSTKHKVLMSALLILLSLALGGAYLESIGNLTATALSTGYELAWWTVDGGGGEAAGGGFALWGIAGQPESAPVLTGEEYSLTGGVGSLGSTASRPTSTVTPTDVPRGDSYVPLVLAD